MISAVLVVERDFVNYGLVMVSWFQRAHMWGFVGFVEVRLQIRFGILWTLREPCFALECTFFVDQTGNKNIFNRTFTSKGNSSSSETFFH